MKVCTDACVFGAHVAPILNSESMLIDNIPGYWHRYRLAKFIAGTENQFNN
jgi:hypothetical protein